MSTAIDALRSSCQCRPVSLSAGGGCCLYGGDSGHAMCHKRGIKLGACIAQLAPLSLSKFLSNRLADNVYQYGTPPTNPAIKATCPPDSEFEMRSEAACGAEAVGLHIELLDLAVLQQCGESLEPGAPQRLGVHVQSGRLGQLAGGVSEEANLAARVRVLLPG